MGRGRERERGARLAPTGKHHDQRPQRGRRRGQRPSRRARGPAVGGQRDGGAGGRRGQHEGVRAPPWPATGACATRTRADAARGRRRGDPSTGRRETGAAMTGRRREGGGREIQTTGARRRCARCHRARRPQQRDERVDGGQLRLPARHLRLPRDPNRSLHGGDSLVPASWTSGSASLNRGNSRRQG